MQAWCFFYLGPLKMLKICHSLLVFQLAHPVELSFLVENFVTEILFLLLKQARGAVTMHYFWVIDDLCFHLMTLNTLKSKTR